MAEKSYASHRNGREKLRFASQWQSIGLNRIDSIAKVMHRMEKQKQKKEKEFYKMARPKKTETEITMQEPAELRIRMTFFEEVLGTASDNPELHDEYIASRNPESPNRAKRITEEVEAIGEGNVVEKQMTIFPKLADGTPFAWDYQIKGMFKECAKMMRYVKGSESSRITNYLQKIDGLIFAKERKIPYQNYKRLGDCQRSLRANTPQGPRVALAHSETVPEGSYIEFTVLTLDPSLLPAVREWLDYGKLHGFGQWRNSGKGRFEWEEISK